MISGQNEVSRLASLLLNQLAEEVSSRILIALDDVSLQKRSHSPTDHKLLITTDELCHSLSVSKSTIINLRKQGLPYVKIGNSVRFDLGEVQQFLNNLKYKQNEKG